jgi:hypothetical protein
MRNLPQLLAAIMLLTAQVAQATTEPNAAATANASAGVVTSSSVKFDSQSPSALVVETKAHPDFDKEVLAPLQAAQAAKAKQEAAQRAALAAKQAAQQTAFRATYGATGPLNNAQITFLGNCESGMTWNRNSGNGFYGAFQFTISTWNAMGTGYARADMAPLEVQVAAVQKLLSRSSIFTQFPGCARQMQARGLI